MYDTYRDEPMDMFIESNEDDLFEDINSDSLLTDDEPSLLDEPDIVKELRQEELQGKLSPLPIYDDLSSYDHVYPDAQPDVHKRVVTNYNDALALAKKALKDIEKS